ncbi:hypothetical protein [Xanthocytophaga flava]|uniref:hypothetical protein n=1 Tax=Xanthocytophaga flava TaxID=3048013 RepID=UPI0028D1B0AE|nr:hypothetical protein [Xanthocytophaga flavus]MDJ1472870.1 hypothetical protein [Xanthocytophaga flavus]
MTELERYQSLPRVIRGRISEAFCNHFGLSYDTFRRRLSANKFSVPEKTFIDSWFQKLENDAMVSNSEK